MIFLERAGCPGGMTGDFDVRLSGRSATSPRAPCRWPRDSRALPASLRSGRRRRSCGPCRSTELAEFRCRQIAGGAEEAGTGRLIFAGLGHHFLEHRIFRTLVVLVMPGMFTTAPPSEHIRPAPSVGWRRPPRTDSVRVRFSGAVDKSLDAQAAAFALSWGSPGDPDPAFREVWPADGLFPHQIEGVAFLLGRSRDPGRRHGPRQDATGHRALQHLAPNGPISSSVRPRETKLGAGNRQRRAGRVYRS